MELAADNRSDFSVASPPSPPVLPKTPPIALALTPSAVNTIANPAANANVGNMVFLSCLSLAALVMYDTVIGSRPKEHGLKLVHNL